MLLFFVDQTKLLLGGISMYVLVSCQSSVNHLQLQKALQACLTMSKTVALNVRMSTVTLSTAFATVLSSVSSVQFNYDVPCDVVPYISA
jgi:uncharacterized protein YcfL